MKIAEGFILKNIAGTNIIVPVGANSLTFKAIITLNESGTFLWQQLAQERTEEELISALLSEYDVDIETAKSDVTEFVQKLAEAGLLG